MQNETLAEYEREYTLKIDATARKKMLAHLEFLARVSIPAMERLYENFKETFEAIRLDPERYTRYIPSRHTDAVLRYKLCGKKIRYRIVFETTGDIVRIYDIQDCRQDTDKNLI